MRKRSWEHFGGRDTDAIGHRPTEDELTQWAESKGFTPTQAQALLCTEQVYTVSARKKLELTREFSANAVQRYNSSRKRLAADEKDHTPTVGMLKVQLNPMHLLVQKAFLASKVRTGSWMGSCFDSAALTSYRMHWVA